MPNFVPTPNPADHARGVAEAVRELNHATLPTRVGDGWEYPADAYDVIGALDQAAGGIPQALDQVRALLARFAVDGILRSTRDVGTDLPDAYRALDQAQQATRQLQTALSRTHAALSALYTD